MQSRFFYINRRPKYFCASNIYFAVKYKIFATKFSCNSMQFLLLVMFPILFKLCTSVNNSHKHNCKISGASLNIFTNCLTRLSSYLQPNSIAIFNSINLNDKMP